MAEFTGFHGTLSESARNIKKNGFDLSRKTGWLGKGVYFFQDNARMAFSFAMRTKRTDDISVLSCEISIPDDKVCDLSKPDTKSVAEFHEFRFELLRKLHDNKLTVITAGELKKDGPVIEMLCSAYEYHLVRKATYTYSELDNLNGDLFKSFVPNAFEICLRDIKYIKTTDILKGDDCCER